MAAVKRSVSFTPELDARIEEARGLIPLSTWLAHIIAEALDGESPAVVETRPKPRAPYPPLAPKARS